MSYDTRPVDSTTCRLVALRAAGDEQARFSFSAMLATTANHTVILATDHATGREIVLKQARPGTGPASQLGLVAEAAMLRYLARRNIAAPRFVALLEHGGPPCLAMSRVPGATLAQLQQRGLASPELVVRSIARLCGALARLHAHGYVHHDIKPANIMVHQLQPVLIDWGSAEAIRPPSLRRQNSSFTHGFASLDQLRGLALPSNDLYAIGASLADLVEWPGPRLAQVIARATGRAGPAYASAGALARELAQLCLLDRLTGLAGLRAI